MAFEREWRDLNVLPRWSLVRVNRRQSVAEHSYYVVLYAMQVAELIHWGGSRADLVRWALVHDAPELEIGDIPGFTKKAVFDGADLDALERRVFAYKFPKYQAWYTAPDDVAAIVKVADIMDCVAYICEEIQSGNKVMGQVYGSMLNDSLVYWQNCCFDDPNRSVLERNLHRLAMAWGRLPIPLGETTLMWLTLLFKDEILPEIDRAYRHPSRRVF